MSQKNWTYTCRHMLALNYYAMTKDRRFFSKLKSHFIISIVGLKYRKLKSSSLQSLLRGRPTEIDYFNGYIVKKAVALGVNVPINMAIVAIIKEIESGKTQISVKNFYDKRIRQAMKDF